MIVMASQELTLFPQSNKYWSATTYQNPGNENNAWNVNFNNGNTNANNKSNTNYVRCLRVLPPPALSLFLILRVTTIFTLEKLYRAYQECRRGKKNTQNALLFEVDREKNLLELLDELKSRTYTIARHICFIVTEPTPREIFAAHFRDRVVHHLLYHEIRGIFEADFSERSYACREEKGTHRAVRQLRDDIRQVKKETGGGWYLKLDVQGFFRSIDKDILYALIEQCLNRREQRGGGFHEGFSLDTRWREEVLWLCHKIIFHNPTANYVYKGDPALRRIIPESKSLFSSGDLGLPIGNLTSQFFANVYLNELDQYVIGTLGMTRYVRYVDDFVIVDADQKRLCSLIPLINQFLSERLHLVLHPKKIHLQPTYHGVDFLGYFVKPTHLLVRQKVVKRFKDKLCRRIDPRDGLLSIDQLPMIQSYFGHFGHANTYRLRKSFGGE